eukprot:TRINITY_DN14093_c0_g3_i1.p1 TRINITY_DN14093_c0_g3~~TRINITY_DN14093_c0_g3_i1.p1  ORF type:complete len:691 (-),score=162.12 TRINITY_DN14093_c0_g3_i1:68-2140(-)
MAPIGDSAAFNEGFGVKPVSGSAAGAIRSLRESGAAQRGSYVAEHELDAVLEQMMDGLEVAKPADPFTWMMRYLADRRRLWLNAAVDAPELPASAGAGALAGGSSGSTSGGARGRRWRISTSACVRRSCKPLLDLILEAASDWEQVEDASDAGCDVYFVWSGQALLSRLAHPAATGPPVAQMPAGAWINRFPGMGCVCDKVNMALALRLLQKLWPEKFRFWPKSWLLPAELDALGTWLEKHKGDTVIVKPEGGSQGDGIFLVQSAADLRVKLSAKPQWGAGFGALAQRYLPSPLLLDGLKFDLRLYVVVTSIEPLCAYMCKEGLARFCTAKYEEPTPANANEVYMHLTNYSVNKKSAKFSDEDPYDVNTKASKRPLATLMAQIAAHEATAGRTFDEQALYNSFEEVCAVLLQALAPVLTVTYNRVARESKPKPKAKAKAKSKPKAKARSRNAGDSSDEAGENEEEGGDSDEDSYEPNCFQILGIDVLMDDRLQPWLLEVNARPSMEISNPVRLADCPPGTRRCVCRDMDGEEHSHVQSEIDVHVKRRVIEGAFRLVTDGGGAGDGPAPAGFLKMNFDRYSPSEAQETLQAVARIYEAAGGAKKAFTTSGLRRALAGAIKDGMSPHEMDTIVTKWKYEGYRQDANSEEDNAEIGVLDFAALLQEVALVRSKGEEEPLDALASLISLCDPED